MSAPTAVEERTADVERLRELALIALIAMIPLASGVVVWSTAGGSGDFNLRVSFSPFDVALIVLLALSLEERHRLKAWRPRTWTARIAVALGAVFTLALLVHPSPRGFDFALRIAALLAIIDAFRLCTSEARQRVLAAIAVVGCVESLIALGESAKGGTVGLGPLEFTGFYYKFGTSTAAHAGFDHPYHLVCFLLLAVAATLCGAVRAINRWPWIAAAALIGAAVPTTFSRAALLAFGPMFVIAMLPWGPKDAQSARRVVMLVATVTLVISGALMWNGWHSKGVATTTGQNVDSNRSDRAREALRLIDNNPVLGVGPGRYTIALRDVEHKDLLPAHNVVLHAGAEGGVLAAVLAAALFIAVGLRALRRGADTSIVFVSLAPFFLLDAYPYTFPTGLAITALWLGLQESVERTRAT